MSVKHTPGPWEWADGDGYSLTRVWGPKGKLIADVVGDDAEVEPNARLIVAAPELLETLKMLVAYNDGAIPDGVNPFDVANKAINKAEGQQ